MNAALQVARVARARNLGGGENGQTMAAPTATAPFYSWTIVAEQLQAGFGG